MKREGVREAERERYRPGILPNEAEMVLKPGLPEISSTNATACNISH